MSTAKTSLQEAIKRKKDQLMDSERKQHSSPLPPGEDGKGDGRREDVLSSHDGIAGSTYFSRSAAQQRPTTEDEKENDGSVHPAASKTTLRQHINRRKAQLIQSQGSSIIITDPQQQE